MNNNINITDTEIKLATNDFLALCSHLKIEIEISKLKRLISAGAITKPLKKNGYENYYTAESLADVKMINLLNDYIYAFGVKSKVQNKDLIIALSKKICETFTSLERNDYVAFSKNSTTMGRFVKFIEGLELSAEQDNQICQIRYIRYDSKDEQVISIAGIKLPAKINPDFIQITKCISVAYVYFNRLYYPEFVGSIFDNTLIFKNYKFSIVDEVLNNPTSIISDVKDFSYEGNYNNWLINTNNAIDTENKKLAFQMYEYSSQLIRKWVNVVPSDSTLTIPELNHDNLKLLQNNLYSYNETLKKINKTDTMLDQKLYNCSSNKPVYHSDWLYAYYEEQRLILKNHKDKAYKQKLKDVLSFLFSWIPFFGSANPSADLEKSIINSSNISYCSILKQFKDDVNRQYVGHENFEAVIIVDAITKYKGNTLELDTWIDIFNTYCSYPIDLKYKGNQLELLENKIAHRIADLINIPYDKLSLNAFYIAIQFITSIRFIQYTRDNIRASLPLDIEEYKKPTSQQFKDISLLLAKSKLTNVYDELKNIFNIK